MAEPGARRDGPEAEPEAARGDALVTCQVCGARQRADDPVLCRVCGEPVLVWGWAP